MRRTLLTMFGTLGVMAVIVAASVVWLVLQEPVTVADAVSTGQYRPLFSVVTQQVGQWCRVLVSLL